MRKQNKHNRRLVPDKRTRAVIYSRVAVAESRKRLAADQEMCRALARQKGWAGVAAFTDVGSGLTLQRAVLTRMRAFIPGKAIGAVIISRLSCLTHSVAHLLFLGQEFEALGIRLHVAQQEREGRL